MKKLNECHATNDVMLIEEIDFIEDSILDKTIKINSLIDENEVPSVASTFTFGFYYTPSYDVTTTTFLETIGSPINNSEILNEIKNIGKKWSFRNEKITKEFLLNNRFILDQIDDTCMLLQKRYFKEDKITIGVSFDDENEPSKLYILVHTKYGPEKALGILKDFLSEWLHLVTPEVNDSILINVAYE